MNRKTLEKITASLVVTLIFIFAFGFIITIANLIFSWDIFSPFMEKIIYFIASSMFIVIVSAAFINMMLNISRLAFFAEKITQNLIVDNKKKK